MKIVIACLKDYISRRNVVLGLDSKQLINSKKPCRGTSNYTTQRLAKDIIPYNNIIGFSPNNCWASSFSNRNTSNINKNEIILNILGFTTKR